MNSSLWPGGPHVDTPFTSSGSEWGWCSCRKCEERDVSLARSPRFRRGYNAYYSKYGVVLDVRNWHERIYKEMWEAWCGREAEH